MRITVRAAYSSHDNLVFTALSIAFSLSIWNLFLLPLAPSFLRACQSLRQPPSWISNRSRLSSCRYCCPSDRPFFSFLNISSTFSLKSGAYHCAFGVSTVNGLLLATFFPLVLLNFKQLWRASELLTLRQTVTGATEWSLAHKQAASVVSRHRILFT